MGKFLDKAGLQTVWGLIKGGFVAKSSVSEKSTTLTWNTETEIANIDGKSIKVKIPAAPTFSNTARLQVSDTTNKRINTKESTGNYIQFTGGTNKFTVADGTNSFDVSVTPSISLAHTITVKSGVKKDGSTEITATSSSAANPTVSLGDSGVSAGIYGPSGDVSGSNGNTIKIPQIRVNAKGIVTEISEKTFTAVNSTYTVNNGSFTIKTKVGSNAAVNVGSTSANASGNSDVTFIQGTNVTLTTDTTNRTITISSTDTNTHNSHGHTFTTTAPTSVGTTLGWGGTFDVVTALGNASATSGNLSSTYTTYRFQLPGNPNTDSKVTQTATTSSNTSWRPLILGGGNNYSDDTVFAPVNVTDGVLSAHLAKFAPSQGIMALVGLKKLGTDGKEVAGSNTTVWNTNGGTTSLSSYLTSQDHYKTSPTAGSYGMKDATTGNNGTKIQIPYITVDGNGHVTSIYNKEYTAVDHTYTVGSANLSLQVNGTSKTTFSANATSAASFNIENGTSTSGNGTFLAGGVAVSIYGLAGAAYKALDADSMTASSTNVPTSKAVAAYVSAALTSVLTYKGTIGSSGATVTALPASHKVGDTYVVSVAGTYAGKACEVGDYIICKTDGTSANDAHWDVVNGENQVENKSASLAGAGSSATIATVDGTNLTITTPSTWTGVAKTGTVTSVATGAGLTGGTITGSGTIKVKLKDETANSADSSKSTSTNGGLYSVEVDKSGNLAVRVPWTDHTYTVNNGTLNLQANGTTKTTFTANQSGNSTFNIATGSENGTISVGGVDVSVKGLGSAAYTNSTAYAPASHSHSYLPLSGGTMALGEGLQFHSDDNYFGNSLDARIISLLDGNDTKCDGGLIIDERGTYNGTTTVTELLRIRDNEFKWKGNTIYHSGNLPAYPTVNNGTLNFQASGTTKATFTANQSGTSNFNIATGSSNGTISVGGTDVAVKGLGSNAYSSTSYLPLSGGTVSGKLTISSNNYLNQLVLDRGNDGGTWGPSIAFCNNGSFMTAIGVDVNGVLYKGDSGNTKYAILHEGNYTSYCAAVDHNHDNTYLKLSGGTLTGAVNLNNTNARIAFGSLTTSPITGYKAPSLLSSGVGIYSRYGGSSDEGALIITEDTCVIYNSADSGWNFQVMDKDLGTDMTVDATRSFGVNSSHQAFSLGGFVKSGSDDSYVLLGGGGHKAVSDFATSGHTHSYLPLSGGVMNAQAVISRAGDSVAWVNGRATPIIKTTSYTGYNSILSMKTTSGSWDLGVYSNDTAYLTYITDTNYSSGNNATTYQLTFPKDTGTIALTKNIPSVSNATITIKQTGQNDQTFTLNGSAATITLADSNTTYSAGTKALFDAGTDTTERVWTAAVLKSAVAPISHSHAYVPVSTTSNIGLDVNSSYIGYINGLTAAAWNYGKTDGAMYTQYYSASWKHQIYGDYRTGHISVRGKNNGTWQNWYSVFDMGNVSAGSNISISQNSSTGQITISSTDTNTWRPIGTGASDAAAGNHTHSTSIAASSATNQITLAFGTKYAITAGGTSYVFTMPGNPNTWRPIQVGGVDKLTDSLTKINFTNSGSASVSYSGGTITIGCSAAANATADSALTAAEVEALLV